jgi:hypothetical protein
MQLRMPRQQGFGNDRSGPYNGRRLRKIPNPLKVKGSLFHLMDTLSVAARKTSSGASSGYTATVMCGG